MVDGGLAGTLSASLCKKLLEIGAFSFLQPSLPARLPIHLQGSILRDLLPNPALCLDIPVMAAVEREMAPGRPQSGFTST